MRLTPDAAYLTVTGRVVASPRGYPGRLGDPVTFLYTGRQDENEWNGLLFLPADTVYKVGPKMINDWAFVGIYEGPHAMIFHSEKFNQGADVLIDRKYAHRLDPLNDDSLLAIKNGYILMEAK